MDANEIYKGDFHEKVTSYNCTNCKRHFHAQVRNVNIFGRIPLILPCTHLMCEECVFHMSKIKNVTCNLCQHVTVLVDDEKSLREIFPIDRFILGALVRQRIPERGVKSPLAEKTWLPLAQFQPAGLHMQNYAKPRNQPEGAHSKNPRNKHIKISDPKGKTETAHCSEYPHCKNAAELRCLECDDIYCNPCNTKVHNAAKAFRKHVRIPIGSLTISDFSVYCTQHRGQYPDYFCVECEIFLCWRCMMNDHKEHEVQTIAEKNEVELPEMKTNLKEAEKMLKRLLCEQQKVKNEMSVASSKPKQSSVELTILRHFANLHSRLQLLQDKVMEEFISAQKTSTLHRIHNELEKNITELKSLIAIGDMMNKSSEFWEKVIIKELTNKVKELLDAPCLLQGHKSMTDCIEFISSEEFITELENHCKIQRVESESGYKLIPLSSFPSNINLLPSDEELATLKETRPISRTSSISSDRSFCSISDPSTSRIRLNLESSSNIVSNHIYKPKEVKNEFTVLKKGACETVIVTHLVSPSLFYVQLTRMNKNIDALNRKLIQYAQHAAIPDLPHLGHIYLARYTNKEFESWYRARILNIIREENGETVYEVFYIDYGNSSVVSKSMLRELTQIFMKDAPFAHECKIHNMIPSTADWEPKVIHYMVDFITGSESTEDADLDYMLHCESTRQMQMIVHDNANGILHVDLHHTDLSSLKCALMFVGWANTTAEEDETYSRPKCIVSNKKIHVSLEKFKKDQLCNVVVTAVVHPNQFYVQIFENKNLINDLERRMNKYYKKYPKKDFIYVPEEGMMCATTFFNNVWKRAEIINLPGNGNVQVFAVDYGEIAIVPWNKIRKLLNDFLALDGQAIRVSLADVESLDSEEWTPEACEYFRNYTEDKVLKMIILEPLITELHIILYEVKTDMDICINALLVRENHATSTGEKSVMVEYRKLIPLDETNTVKYNTRGFEENASRLPLKKKTEIKLKEFENSTKHLQTTELSSIVKEPAFRKTVSILNIDSPDCFYVTLPDWIPLRNKLLKDMKQFYDFRDPVLVEWKPNDKCAVLSIKENAWYRGIILNIADDMFTIFLKDIALEEQLPPENIFELDSRFLSVRDLAIRCSLAGVKPAGDSDKWALIALEKFKEFVSIHPELYITKQGDIKNKSLPVNLYSTWEEIVGPLEPSIRKHSLINKCLIDHGLALPLQGFVFDELESSDINVSDNRDPFDNVTDTTVENPVPEETIPEKSLPNHWLPALPLTEQKFQAKVTYVDNDGCLYLHSLHFEHNMEQMKKILNKNFLKTAPDAHHSWTIGQMCTVQYYLDKSYYRATILDIIDDEKILVKFVDYGNEEDCTHDQLRSDVMMITEPIMATKCKLFNVEPRTTNGKWPVSLLDKLHATIVDKVVDVEVVEKQEIDVPVNVILILDATNINLQVMSADWYEEEKQEIKGVLLQEEDDDVVIEGSINESETSDDKIGDWVSMVKYEQLNEVKFHYVSLPENTKTFEAIVINVLNYDTIIIEGNFNVDNVQKTERQFDKLLKDMNENAHLQPPVFDPSVGQACCTQFSDDKNWYRAEVYSIDNSDETGLVQVLYVDYGNLDIVPRENIKMLRKEWAEYPVQQLKCKIWGIKKADHVGKDEACKIMSELLLEKRLLLIVKSIEPVFQANLLDMDSTCLAYKQAIDEGTFIISH